MQNTVPSHFLLSMVQLDRSADTPLYRQVYERIRRAILDGDLDAGVRLPSTRDLADLLDVSRTTVVNAFDQLRAEGYLETRVGAGTFVTESLPEHLLYVSTPDSSAPAPADAHLSERGERFARIDSYTEPSDESSNSNADHAFTPGIPDLSAFPVDLWARLSSTRYRTSRAATLGYQSDQDRLLRQAIAEYLNAARGVTCEPAQIIIVSGSQQALFLAARILLDPGEQVWMEEPGYLGAKGALYSAGAEIVPVPVDDAGLDVDAGIARAPEARVAYVTPSHQFPLGHTMSLSRRTRLLQWAHEAGAWIIEDDYDSEYRYSGRPLASLQGLDAGHRVIYVGTFSKVLFPSLRLGYVVAPPALVDAFAGARMMISRPPALNQAVLADFIMDGHFTRHIRRMRTHYAERRDAFVEAMEQHLAGLLELGPVDAGLHAVGWLPAHADDRAAVRRAAARDVDTQPLSLYHLEEPARSGLVLGYAATAPAAIRAGAWRLAAALEEIA